MRTYFEALDGPATPFLALLCDEVLGRGEGILSKSMSEVRATGRKDDRSDLVGETAGRVLARFCIGPVVIHRLLDDRNKGKNITYCPVASTLPNHRPNHSRPCLDVPLQPNSFSSPLDEAACVHPLAARFVRTVQTHLTGARRVARRCLSSCQLRGYHLCKEYEP
jgi:hypothetical protein